MSETIGNYLLPGVDDVIIFDNSAGGKTYYAIKAVIEHNVRFDYNPTMTLAIGNQPSFYNGKSEISFSMSCYCDETGYDKIKFYKDYKYIDSYPVIIMRSPSVAGKYKTIVCPEIRVPINSFEIFRGDEYAFNVSRFNITLNALPTIGSVENCFVVDTSIFEAQKESIIRKMQLDFET